MSMSTALCLFVLALAVLPALGETVASQTVGLLGRRWLFIAAVFLAAFVFRWPMLTYPLDLNYDESRMLAQALTLLHYPVPWKSYDGTTSGPLDTAVLALPALFGISPGFLTTRIIGIAIFGSTIILLYGSVKNLYGELAGRLSVIAPLAFFCVVQHPDFLPYMTETLPILLVSACIYLLTKVSAEESAIASYGAVGLLLGALPFAKLQGLPLGALLGLIAVVIVSLQPEDDQTTAQATQRAVRRIQSFQR